MNGTLYDLVNAFAEHRILRPSRCELLAGLSGDMVDVGAGTGANFPCYRADAHVLALEPDPSMAQRAKAKCETTSARIELQVADDHRLEALPPNSFDVAILTLVLCTVEDPAATLRRVRRVLKANGILILIEHVRSSGRVGRLQDRITPFWELIAGGCHLNRNTGATVVAAEFDVKELQAKRLSRFSPIQKLIYGRLHQMTAV